MHLVRKEADILTSRPCGVWFRPEADAKGHIYHRESGQAQHREAFDSIGIYSKGSGPPAEIMISAP